MDINLIIITLIYGGLILLAFLNLTPAFEVNRKANVCFGLFALIWATFWLDEVLFATPIEDHPIAFVTIRFIQFFAPLTFFFSVVLYTNPNYSYKTGDLRYLLAPLVFLILMLCHGEIDEQWFGILYIVLVFGHALFYTSFAYLKILHHQRAIELFSSNKEFIDLNWIKYIIYVFISSSALTLLYNVFATAESLNSYINLFFLGVVYFVAYHQIRQKEIYPVGLNGVVLLNEPVDDVPGSVSKTKLMDDHELKRIQQELLALMQQEKPYLDSELNLVKLADRLQISSHQLSYVINQGFGINFFHFINQYRVKRAEELLTDPQYDHLTIVAIGFESGFNSKTSFNTTFKKITSHTPTAYRKIHLTG